MTVFFTVGAVLTEEEVPWLLLERDRIPLMGDKIFLNNISIYL